MRHAIFEDFRVVWLDEQERQLRGKLVGFVPTHVSELWEIAQECHISHFWIMPGSCIDRWGYDFFTARENYNIFVPLADRQDRPHSPRAARCWKENSGGGTHQIFVFFPGRGPWDWTIHTGIDVLATLDYLQYALPMENIEWSPQAMGERYLKKLFSGTNRLQTYIRDSSENLDKLPFKRADKDLIWRSKLEDNMEGLFIHLYDKNAAHPSAAASMTTGCGDPVHLLEEESGRIEPKYPGIYRVFCDDNISLFNGGRLPHIIESEWCTLATLKFAMKQRCILHIKEAYVFPEHQILFDEWTHDLWSARVALKDTTRFKNAQARENAELCVKDIMNHTISSLRLNWWTDMVGMSRTCLLANLAKFAAGGHYPLLIYYDGIAFTSPIPSPRIAIPNILDREEKLGGYKHVYTLQVTRQMIKDCKNIRAGGMLKYFHALAREKGLRA